MGGRFARNAAPVIAGTIPVIEPRQHRQASLFRPESILSDPPNTLDDVSHVAGADRIKANAAGS
jgi:hypothetical protein